MAELTTNHYVMVWSNGMSDKCALFALRNVTTGDTADLSADFSVAKQAVILGTTVAGTESVPVSGNIATIPTGLSSDAGYLLVWGASA
jgi:hypothetical protein